MKQVEKDLSLSLIDIKAVLLRPSQPFTWASGWHSPIYCDNRKILSHPEIRNYVADKLSEIVKDKYSDVEVIAGVATGAIAVGVLVAERMNKPFVYVRPKAKDHGTGSKIEGELPIGAKVVVIEDLISTGMSSLAAVDALREAGANVMGMAAIFTYSFAVAEQSFKEKNVCLDTLSNYPALIEMALEKGYINQNDLSCLRQWRENPSEWNKV